MQLSSCLALALEFQWKGFGPTLVRENSYWSLFSSKSSWFLAPLHWSGYQEDVGSGVTFVGNLGAATNVLFHSAGTVVSIVHGQYSSTVRSDAIWL